MFGGFSLTRPLLTLVTRYLDLLPETVMGSRRHFSMQLCTRLRSSARSESSGWCAAKLAVTICKIFPALPAVSRFWPLAWLFSCFLWLAYRHWQDFLESSTCSAPPYVSAEIRGYCGWLAWRCLAALSPFIIT